MLVMPTTNPSLQLLFPSCIPPRNGIPSIFLYNPLSPVDASHICTAVGHLLQGNTPEENGLSGGALSRLGCEGPGFQSQLCGGILQMNSLPGVRVVVMSHASADFPVQAGMRRCGVCVCSGAHTSMCKCVYSCTKHTWSSEQVLSIFFS